MAVISDVAETQQDRADPIGDLARDVAGEEDPDVPDSPAGFVQYVGHIGSVEAQEAAIKASAEYLHGTMPNFDLTEMPDKGEPVD